MMKTSTVVACLGAGWEIVYEATKENVAVVVPDTWVIGRDLGAS